MRDLFSENINIVFRSFTRFNAGDSSCTASDIKNNCFSLIYSCRMEKISIADLCVRRMAMRAAVDKCTLVCVCVGVEVTSPCATYCSCTFSVLSHTNNAVLLDTPDMHD